MLTLGNANTTQAKNYYKQENYYSKEEAEANSAWRGKGASGHQLSGAITDLAAYDNIVNGLSPDGKTQLREKQNHKGKKERAGTDLTFSAPKSVSIACLVGGDTRLEEAHRKAVARTIDLIESRYAQTRINGQPVQTDNLIVAQWHHDTSRELDPHLHTHCLIMNCTKGPDGKWRSINNKLFYQNKMLLGQIYRNELALECRKLGYEIEPHPQELFEIKGYTREQIEGFSKRHEQIKDKLIEMGAELTTENKAWAWRKTRVKKNHEIRRDEKLPYWQEEADLYGITTHPVPTAEQNLSSTSSEQNEQIAAEIELAVDAAIEHCSERQVAFTGEDIEKFVIAEVKRFSIHQLEQAIAEHPELIKAYDGRRYTTQTALARELATIRLMQEGKRQVSPIATPETIDSYLADKSLTSGQREAVALSATTCDQFIAWQGVAGAGKTYALNQVKQVATALNDIAPGYIIKGFAPSAEAAKVLGEELGIEANTVARLLVSQQLEQPPPNQIWIVDEAGLLSAKNALSLLQRATEEKARVILVGDTRQLSAIEAGNPFKSLQSAGIATAYLDESLRQKPPDLQKAVGLAANGQIGEALSHLQQLERIEELTDPDERTAKIAADYIKLSPKERQQTLIVAGTHQERVAITEQIREALKEEGTLGYGVEVTQLRAKQNLTSVQTRYTHNYSVGDVVVPIRDYKRLGLHKSQPYRVEAIRGDKLHLQDLVGNQLVVDPMKFRKTLYKQENIDIAVGDRLRWTRNDKELGRRNGQEFTVTEIDGHTATIELPGGKTDTIDLYQPLHLDHALVATTYSSQGKTANRVLISSTVDATVSQESVYVAISRAKYDLKIYAEDIDYLLEQAQESKAQETVWEVLNPPSKVQVAAAPVFVTSQLKVEVATDVVEAPQLKQKKSSIVNIRQPSKQHEAQRKAQLKVRPILKKEPPKQLEVFWQPTKAPEAPPHIEMKHWQELVEGSAIHPDIAAANFRSLQMGSIEQEHESWEYLMYSERLERTNTGQLNTGYLKRYAHIEAGGWWCNSGANALSFSNLETGSQPQEKIWGCYKPNEPRSNPDKPGKVIKYEHPPKTDLGIFLLDVPEYIAQKIYQKAGVDPSQEDRDRGFWYCVWKHNLPVVITEGAKKAASLLSQGHAAIGLPGIYAGYRSKDEQGNPIKAHLHEELAAFATLGRRVTFCFDFETRLETKRNIEIAISRTGSLLRQQGAKVNVVSLEGPEKGVDDLIVAQSPLAYEQQYSAALPLQQWREANKQQRQQGIAPPQKLTIAQRIERLNQSSLGQPPINNQSLNQSQEQISHDIIEQQLNREYATNGGVDQSHNLIDQENRPVRENKQPTYEQQQSTERISPTPGNYPDPEPGRIESQPSELFAAISRHLELEKVEQLGADVTELNDSLADGFLSTSRAEEVSQIIAQQSEVPQQVEQSKTQENLSQLGKSNDGRDTRTERDRQFDSQHRTVSSEHRRSDRQFDSQHGAIESSEHRSFAGEHQIDAEHRRVESPEQRISRGEQGTQELHSQAVERQPLDSQANARRLHHPVQVSFGATEVGQTERHNSTVSDGDEQSVAQTRRHQPGSNPSQRAGDGGLRGDRQPAEATQEQREEVATSNNGQWAQALGKLAQVVQSVNDWQILGNAELNRKLTVLTGQIDNLNIQQKPSKFLGLSELAQTLTGQQSQEALVGSLEQIEPALSKLTGQVVAINKLPQTTNSALISDLQPQIQDLAQAVTTWQSQVDVAQALAKTDQLIQQLVEQRHTFDFGELPSLLSQVNYEQLLTQSGLDVGLASLTQQLTQFTPPAPTVFAGMNAIAESLLSHQAQSQLPIAGLVETANAIAQQITDLKPKSKAHEYKFEGSAALGELAQTLYCFTTEQQLTEGGLLQQVQQTTNKAISVISQHNEQLQEDLSMLKTVKQTKAAKRLDPISSSYTRQNIATIANQVRDLPLEEVAISLGLTRDKRDRHKWRAEGFIVSINEQKFTSTWLKGEGGVGAISFVLHVWGKDPKKPSPGDFTDAVNWLSSQGNYQALPPQTSLQSKITPESKLFQPPVPDENKWHEVKQYLVEKRGLPSSLVDELHSDGKIYAAGLEQATLEKLRASGYLSPEKITNAVFLRHNLNNEVTGASLRGVSDNSQFKGLSIGSHREGGCFSFVQGEGELKRIVIVESAIDALSAAALAKQPGQTMFISTDGAGSVPVSWLKQQQQQGVEIVAAHDADRPGEDMAWRLAAELGAVTRATPIVGKDWNEHLLGIESQPDPAQWNLVAQAIGKPDAYISRIEAVIVSGQLLPIEAAAAMRQDFDTYKQTASKLWQWHQAAKDIGKSDAYFGRIADCAIAFHHPKKPTPLSAEAIATMQQDLLQHEQLSTAKSWQHHNPITDITRLMRTDFTVAHTDAKDSSSLQQEQLNTRALKLSVRLLSEFAKNQHSDRVSWTGGWYTFTKAGSDIKIDCSQRQATILKLSSGNLQGSITHRDIEKFEQVLEAIKEKEIGKQPEL